MVAPLDQVDDHARLDLRSAQVLCADESSQGLDILSQILMGFGVQHIVRAQSADEVRHILSSQTLDLMLLDAGLGGNGHEIVRWLRTSQLEPNRYIPVLVLAGYTPKSQIEQARDCGSSFVVTKPISAKVLLERIFWLGRAKRLFVEAPNYSGPDRRFKNDGVPGGVQGRRKGDLSAHVGEAQAPNMSQDQIDSLIKPQKVAL
ncbi:response regulator [Brevundimonas sp.]|uniref:response regulator n=1 Tax=Brevundimonas sp. TaxID=1871086 RepID=UPI003AF60D7D